MPNLRESTLPIKFNLVNPVGLDLIYLQGNGQRLTLEFSHHLENSLSFPPLTPSDPSASAYHLALSFRRGFLDLDQEIKLRGASAENWQVSRREVSDQIETYFLKIKNDRINEVNKDFIPLKKLRLELANVFPRPDQGTHDAQVQLRYRVNQGVEEIESFRHTHLKVTHQSETESFPLHMDLLGGNRVLNDGTANTLTLYIINHLNPDAQDITFQWDPNYSKRSKFILSFQSGEDELSFATEDELRNIEIDPPDAWEKDRREAGPNILWILTPKENLSEEDQVLDINHFLKVKISGIKTFKPAGLSHLYIRYENISGDRNGYQVCLIERSPLLVKESQLGEHHPVLEVASNSLQVNDKITTQSFSTGSTSIGEKELDMLNLLTAGQLNIQRYPEWSGNEEIFRLIKSPKISKVKVNVGKVIHGIQLIHGDYEMPWFGEPTETFEIFDLEGHDISAIEVVFSVWDNHPCMEQLILKHNGSVLWTFGSDPNEFFWKQNYDLSANEQFIGLHGQLKTVKLSNHRDCLIISKLGFDIVNFSYSPPSYSQTDDFEFVLDRPDKPSFQLNDLETEATVTWNPINGASKYILEVAEHPSDSNPRIFEVTDTEFTFEMLGKKYNVRVKATTPVWGVESSWSDTLMVKVPAKYPRITIAASLRLSLYIKEDSNRPVWGAGAYPGTLESADSNHYGWGSSPSPCIGIEHIVSIAAGGDLCLFLDESGTAWSVSDGTTFRDTPHLTGKLSIQNVVAIAVDENRTSSAGGAYNRCALLDKDGNVWMIDTEYYSGSKLTKIANLEGACAIAVGSGQNNNNHYILCLRDDGTVWGQGGPTFQLGQGQSYDIQETFSQVYEYGGRVYDIGPGNEPKPLYGIIAIATCYSHSLFLSESGSTYAAGFNDGGQCGWDYWGAPTNHPYAKSVYVCSSVQKIACGGGNSLFLDKNGFVYGCGQNREESLGGQYSNPIKSPMKIQGLENIVDIAVSENHSIFLKKDGTVMAMGSNKVSQLGIGEIVMNSPPISPPVDVLIDNVLINS
jgi:alpha-tubulin suppressor-like RCC1 family protein